MRILGLRIGWFNSGGRKSRKAVTRMERVARDGLLEAAKKDPGVLFGIVNKYGQIREYDKSESELQKIEDQIYQKAVRNILKDGSRELDAWIDEIIERVMGMESGYRGQQNETIPLHRHPDIQQNLGHVLSSPAFSRNLKLAAIVGKLSGNKEKHKEERR
jgi:hypothetical protein